nr:immunoglobulin light chain junction region [Macaca mulatta]MOX17417.1 immunoglobulin light chain junction region [Macaca mulatta]MOX18068.1 immunoglobulin light chain junction region [Macaca mulatta]MOX18111.1 immunoglobulin light chain junction region [Macaca mulatta]MOX18655.1 immunoglobulin light chain junction region [Macaca mulatta]
DYYCLIWYNNAVFF